MLDRVRQRWPVVPPWLKVAVVGVLLALLSALHARLSVTSPHLVPLVQRLFFIPLFMASLQFGLKGGLVCAALISLNYYEAMLGALADGGLGGKASLGLELGLYFVTGGVTGLLVDRERREAARVKRHESLALLGQAAAALAHELKNPLVAIGGFAQRIYNDTEEGHPHRLKLRIIVDQVAHMERLLREVLDYSRPMRLRLERAGLHDLAAKAVDMTGLVAEEAGVRLASENAGEDVQLMVDAPRLSQVLTNLVHNAIHASPRGGEVRVVCWRRKGQAVVEVRDQGQGVDPADLERIFTPFYTTKTKGTGLGLAVSRKIVEAHGGWLRVESQPGQGASFFVHLPLAGPSRAEPSEAVAA